MCDLCESLCPKRKNCKANGGVTFQTNIMWVDFI